MRSADVRVAIIRTIVNEELGAGWHRLQWDARDGSGQAVQPGVYFVRARSLRDPKHVDRVRLDGRTAVPDSWLPKR